MNRLTLLVAVFPSLLAFGQNQTSQRVELLNAGSMTITQMNHVSVTVLKENVKLRNQDGTFQCDSAIWWRDLDKFLAYSRVNFIGNDGVKLRGNELDYQEGVALVKGPVTLVHGNQTLSTPLLRYNTHERTGTFSEGGIIQTPDGTMSCGSGSYWAKDQHFQYRYNVIAETEDYRIHCERMEHWPDARHYYIPSPGIAHNVSKSIGNENSEGLLRFGKAWVWMDKDSTISAFSMGVEGLDSTIMFQADSLYKKGESTSLYSNDGIAKWADWSGDSLEIHGTYIFRNKATANAEGNVATFAKGLVCKSESMNFNAADSTLHFSGKPFVWADEYVLHSDSLRWYQHNSGKLDSLYGSGLVHISKPIDSLRFDEMSGHFLSGLLDSNGIKSMNISGNAQASFQPDSNRSSLIQCAEINLEFDEGKLHKVRFVKNPQGTVTSPNPTIHLPGFSDEFAQRPARMEAISGLK